MYRSVLLLELQTNRPNSDAGFYSLTSKRSDVDRYSPDHDLETGGLLKSQTLSEGFGYHQPQLKSALNGYHNSSSMSSESASPVTKKHVTFKIDNKNFPSERRDILPDYFGERPKREVIKPQIKQTNQVIPSSSNPIPGRGGKPSGPITSARVRYSRETRERSITTSERKPSSPNLLTRQKLSQELIKSNNRQEINKNENSVRSETSARNEFNSGQENDTNTNPPVGINRPWTPLARISESASTSPFEIRKNRVPISRLRNLANERDLRSQPNYGTKSQSSNSEDEYLTYVETARSWKSPSPQLVNNDSRTIKSSNSQEEQKTVTTSMQRINVSSSFRPHIPLRVVTPTFEDAVNIPRRSKTSLGTPMKIFPDEKPPIETGIESRPRSRNYSFANRPVINGKTQVFLAKSTSTRVSSACHRPRIRRSSANLEQLVSSCVSSAQQSQNNDESAYGSSTDLDLADSQKPKPKDFLLQKTKYTDAVEISNDHVLQSVVTNKQVSASSKILAVELKYIVLQERIANCSPLIPSEEKLVDFFLQRGSQKHHANRDRSNCLFFTYQVSFQVLCEFILGFLRFSVKLSWKHSRNFREPFNNFDNLQGFY